MAGAGFILGAIFLLTTLLSLHTWTEAILGLDTVPEWANITVGSDTNFCADLIQG